MRGGAVKVASPLEFEAPRNQVKRWSSAVGLEKKRIPVQTAYLLFRPKVKVVVTTIPIRERPETARIIRKPGARQKCFDIGKTKKVPRRSRLNIKQHELVFLGFNQNVTIIPPTLGLA